MVEKQATFAEDRLDAIESRLSRIESLLLRSSDQSNIRNEKETPVEPWKHLVARNHPWRKQLFIKGRNMTVRHLVGGVQANQFSEEQAAANYHLPVEAIREACTYAQQNAEILDLDAAHERYLLAQKEKAGKGVKGRASQPVS